MLLKTDYSIFVCHVFCVLYANTVNNTGKYIRLIQTINWTFWTIHQNNQLVRVICFGKQATLVTLFWLTKKDQFIRALFHESDHNSYYIFVFYLSPLANLFFCLASKSQKRMTFILTHWECQCLNADAQELPFSIFISVYSLCLTVLSNK